MTSKMPTINHSGRRQFFSWATASLATALFLALPKALQARVPAPKAREQVQGIVKSIWVCPSFCGCALDEVHTFVVSDDVRAKHTGPLGRIWIRFLEETGGFDKVTTARTVAIDEETGKPLQCAEHAPLLRDVNTAWADELRHFHGNACRPDTCVGATKREGCCMAYWFDDRQSDEQGNQIVTVLNHPGYTARCAAHAHLTDPVEQYEQVKFENQSKNYVVNALGEAMGLQPTDFRFSYTHDRTLTLTLPMELEHRAAEFVQAIKALRDHDNPRVSTVRVLAITREANDLEEFAAVG